MYSLPRHSQIIKLEPNVRFSINDTPASALSSYLGAVRFSWETSKMQPFYNHLYVQLQKKHHQYIYKTLLFICAWMSFHNTSRCRLWSPMFLGESALCLLLLHLVAVFYAVEPVGKKLMRQANRILQPPTTGDSAPKGCFFRKKSLCLDFPLPSAALKERYVMA